MPYSTSAVPIDPYEFLRPPPEQKQATVREYLGWLLNQEEFLRKMHLLSAMGALDGLQAMRQTKFFERLQESPEAKYNLARYLTEKEIEPVARKQIDSGSKHPVRLFFESGSTIAYLIGRTAQTIKGMLASSGNSEHIVPFNGRFLTNNLFSFCAFAGLVKSPEPTPGGLDDIYYGLFPFADTEPHEEEAQREECDGFEAIKRGISKCERVFATCSSFSFLTGPLVGSRANALFKRAIASGVSQWPIQRYYLLFHFEKIVPLSTAFDDTEASMRPVKDACYHVFPVESKLSNGAVKAAWLESLRGGKAVTPSSEKDRSGHGKGAAPQIPPKLEWHARFFEGNGGNVKTALSSLITDFKDAYRDVAAHSYLESETWLKFLQVTRLVIALPYKDRMRQKALDVLDQELLVANALLAAANVKAKYDYGMEEVGQRNTSKRDELRKEFLNNGVAVIHAHVT